MNIKVASVEKKSWPSGGTYWRVGTDTGWFTVKSKEIGDVIAPNQEWDVEVEVKGDFKTIISGKQVEDAAKASPPPAETQKYSNSSKDNRMIAREVALKAAVELAGYNIAKGTAMSSAEITKVAEFFFKWLKEPPNPGDGLF